MRSDSWVCTWLWSDVPELGAQPGPLGATGPPCCLPGWGGNGNKASVRITADEHLLTRKKKNSRQRHEGGIKFYVFCLYDFEMEQIEECKLCFKNTWKHQKSYIFSPFITSTEDFHPLTAAGGNIDVLNSFGSDSHRLHSWSRWWCADLISLFQYRLVIGWQRSDDVLVSLIWTFISLFIRTSDGSTDASEETD